MLKIILKNFEGVSEGPASLIGAAHFKQIGQMTSKNFDDIFIKKINS